MTNRQQLRRWAQAALVGWILMLVVWLVPPVWHSLRHLCPVRPDGTPEAQAVPAFARKYGISCTQCHTSWPLLNDYGRQFKLNGYVRESGSEEGVLKTSDGAFWTEKTFPISLVVRSRPLDNGKSSISNAGGNMGGSDGSNGYKFQAVNDFDMFIAGGDVARHVSWFGEMDANAAGGFTPAMADLQLGWHPSQYYNFVAGRRGFYVMDPYQTLTNFGSTTLANRSVAALQADQDSLSGTTMDSTNQTLMTYGEADKEGLGGLYYSAGVTAPKNDDMGKGPKTANLRLAFDTLKGFMIGGFGTWGHDVPANIPANSSNVNNPGAAPAGPGVQVKYVKTGVDTMLDLGRIAARGAFLYTYDRDELGVANGLIGAQHQMDRAAYAELLYVWKLHNSSLPFLVPLIRENWYTTYGGTRQFNYVTAQLTHYFAGNLKAFLEYSVDTKGDPQGFQAPAPAVRAPKGNRITGQIELGF